MARRRLQADESKSIILSHARTLFIEKGYKDATMDDLCRLTQLSKGNIYHHFKNKEDIFVQIIEAHVKELSQKWLTAEYESMSPVDQLLTLADIYGRDCANPLLSSVEEYFKTLTDDSPALQSVTESLELVPNAVRSVVERGIEQRSFNTNDVESLSFAVMSMLIGATQLCIAMPRLSSDEYADLHVNAIRLLLTGMSNK